MRVSTVAIVAGLLLASVPARAQAQQAQTQTPPAQAKPAAQTPAPPVVAPRPPAVFPEGARVAFISLQAVAAESIEGKGYSAKIQKLQLNKQADLEARNKALQASQQKAAAGANAMSDAAQAELQKQIERLQVELQRAQQDAQSEVQDLTTQLQTDFQRKILPIIEQVASKKGLHMVFSVDAGIVWANPGLDITAEVIKAFDSSVTQPARPPAPPK